MVVRWWLRGDDGSRLRWSWWLRWWHEMAWRWRGDIDSEDDRGGEGDELIVVVTWEVCVGVVAGATVAAEKVREKWVARYFSFGRHLEDLHVTLAHLEKKRTRLRTNTIVLTEPGKTR
ncbi:hypothetical protein Tco_0731489 [Tanacetum coccineum]